MLSFCLAQNLLKVISNKKDFKKQISRSFLKMKSIIPWYKNVLGVGSKFLVAKEGACQEGFCGKSGQLHN